jgi:hypothetical protein
MHPIHGDLTTMGTEILADCRFRTMRGALYRVRERSVSGAAMTATAGGTFRNGCEKTSLAFKSKGREPCATIRQAGYA